MNKRKRKLTISEIPLVGQKPWGLTHEQRFFFDFDKVKSARAVSRYTLGVPAGVALMRGVSHICQIATTTPLGETHCYRHNMRRKKCLSYPPCYVRNTENVPPHLRFNLVTNINEKGFQRSETHLSKYWKYFHEHCSVVNVENWIVIVVSCWIWIHSEGELK